MCGCFKAFRDFVCPLYRKRTAQWPFRQAKTPLSWTLLSGSRSGMIINAYLTDSCNATAMGMKDRSGFTLIEMSIVLVIIGLIVGGVLVGQDLIRAAAVRSQISQIEKYQTAVNTFRGKYGAMPGDMSDATARQYGFQAVFPTGQFRGGANPLAGNGNGMLIGSGQCSPNPGHSGSILQAAGETVVFWEDLSTAGGMNLNLIDGTFSTADICDPTIGNTIQTNASFRGWLPDAKIGRGNFIYVYNSSGTNYYGLSVPLSIDGSVYRASRHRRDFP